MRQPPRIRLETSSAPAVCLQGDRICPEEAPADLVLDLGDASLSPGLINAHDHLHRNHYPRLGRPPYLNAYEWGSDIHARDADRIAVARTLPRRDALIFGALKNLLAGVTAVVHHDRWEDAFDRDFPIHVLRVNYAHSLGLDAERVAGSSPHGPLWLHLAEGVDDAAAAEICSLEQAGLLHASLVAVHVVGADAQGVRQLRAAGAGVVWCPTSNLYLYGATAPAALLAPGIEVMLGSDSLLSADGTLLDELRAARTLGFLDDVRLLAAVTTTPARRLGIDGSSAMTEQANVVAFRQPILDAGVADVSLVVVNGQPRVADVEFAEVFAVCGIAAQRIRCGKFEKLVAEPLAESWRRGIDAGAEAPRVFGLPRLMQRV